MRRTPIRMKLAAALAVPLIGLSLITAVEVIDIGNQVDDVRSQADLARATVGPSGLITSLADERTWAVVELVGQQDFVQPAVIGYEDTRAQTDAALTAFRDALASGDPAAEAAYRPALDDLSELEALRDQIDGGTAPHDLDNVPFANDVFDGYAALIRPFLDATTRVALAIDDAQLRQATTLVDIATRQVEASGELSRTAIIEIVFNGGLKEPRQIALIADLKRQWDEANEELLAAPPPLDVVIDEAYPTEFVENLNAQLDAALAGENPEFSELLAAVDVPPEEGTFGLRNALADALVARADELSEDAERRELIYVAAALGTLLAAIILTWTVSRSITRPLRALTRQAKEMADRRLPEAVTDILETPLGEDVAVPRVRPVKVRTRDEVADVADALNTVQDTALDLAVEQAVLRRNIADSFVNLGRRNQNLLGRQLDFITELESSETEPDALSNLFRLDHLATRMRRNAESLLVLAGIEPPRQWAAPVRLTDVIRAALGEVEDYQRVTVRGVEPATIVGSAAADLAHLLAELIENALVFSPPDRTVDIRGRNRDHGGYTLAVIDAGLGMPAGDIAAANRRLAGAESFTVAPSKYLGHYVAGNLAARHEIQVHLQNSHGPGITATLDIPAALLTSELVTTAPVTPPGGHRALPAGVGTSALAQPPSQDPWPVTGLDPHRGPSRGPGPGLGGPAPAGSPLSLAPPGAAPAGPPPAPLWPPTPPAPPTPMPAAPSRAVPDAPSAPAARQGVGPLGPFGPPRVSSSPDGMTAGGLARRRSTGSHRRVPTVIDDPDLLARLERYGPGPGTGGPGPAAPPAGGPAPLTRRVRGAQLPRTTLTPLRGAPGVAGAEPPAPAPAPITSPTPAVGWSAPWAAPRPAADVQDLLARFSAGVQRGLDEARRAAGAGAADQPPNTGPRPG
jgi:signal transduction histidine kinase